MTFKLLKLYLKTGKILAITPTTTKSKKNSKCKQLHQIFMVTFIAVGVTVSLYFRNFYLQHNIAKITVCLLTDFALAVFNGRIVVEASKTEKWAELIKGLDRTSGLEEEEKFCTNRHYWKFWVPHLLFWGATVYMQQYWVYILGSLQLKQYAFEVLQTYIQFFYTFYVHTILGLIEKRYEGLKKHFEERWQYSFCQFEHYVCDLKEVVISFNDNFGWSLLLLVSFTTLQFLNYLEYNLRSEDYGKENLPQVIVAQVLAILVSFVPTVMVILKCETVMKVCEEMLFLIFKTSTNLRDFRRKKELERLYNVLATNLPLFSAARFFVIGRNTILNIFGTVATFLIVLVTFQPNVSQDAVVIYNQTCTFAD